MVTAAGRGTTRDRGRVEERRTARGNACGGGEPLHVLHRLRPRFPSSAVPAFDLL